MLQIVYKQLVAQKSIFTLLGAMIQAYSFPQEVGALALECSHFEKNVARIFQQTIECSLFVHENTGHGFSGKSDSRIRNGC